MKAIILARVSTEEQKEAGNSLPAQTERLESYCKRKGFEIVKNFSFDESAYKKKRDEFDKLLEIVQEVSKKEKIAVCFDKVDRFNSDRGKGFNYFTTCILNHFRQLYRTAKNYNELKKKYNQFIKQKNK